MEQDPKEFSEKEGIWLQLDALRREVGVERDYESKEWNEQHQAELKEQIEVLEKKLRDLESSEN